MTYGAIIAEIAGALDDEAEESTRDWWERYLKGAAEFRGVKMARIRSIVNGVVKRHDLAPQSDSDAVVEVALALMAERYTEDKLAGVLVLAEHTLPFLGASVIDQLARPLTDGSVHDWNVCDWYCVKVLGPLIISDDGDVEERARRIAAWTDSDALWQRRAGVVAFVNHAATEPELFDGFTELLLEACATNAGDDRRWSQTSVGWFLRELSRRDPAAVERFLDEHPELSTEAVKNARKYLT